MGVQTGTETQQSNMKKIKTLLALVALTGCVALQPGADPLVVRTEQALRAGNATFKFVLHVNQNDRGFWAQNAPAFGAFCDWLRTPTMFRSNSVARCDAMLLNVNALKHSYQGNKSVYTSNTLYVALATLQAATAQAGSWSNIVTMPTN